MANKKKKTNTKRTHAKKTSTKKANFKKTSVKKTNAKKYVTKLDNTKKTKVIKSNTKKTNAKKYVTKADVFKKPDDIKITVIRPDEIEDTLKKTDTKKPSPNEDNIVLIKTEEEEKKKIFVLLFFLFFAVAAIIGNSLGIYFVSKPTIKEIKVIVPEINGLTFSNLEAKVDENYYTDIVVDPVITNGCGLPSALTSVKSADEIKDNEYTYTLSANKVTASLEIPGEFIKDDIIIDFKLTDTITYTVSFDLNGGTGEAPSQTFNYKDSERLVEEPEIPTYLESDFVGWFLNDTEEYDFYGNVNSDLTLHACYDIDGKIPAVTATKESEKINYTTLDDFRDAVNSETNDIDGFEGWTVKLNKYINLHNEEWTPIGTGEHPFKGIFDGRNKTVYNFKVPYNKTEDPKVDTCGGALFGYVEGTSNVLHNDSLLEDFYNSETYEVTPPEENTFSCVIKNLKLKNIETIDKEETNDEDYTAALVSSVNNAYISNIKLDDATINAENKVGGIIGTVVKQGVAVFDKLTTTKDVKVNGDGNHVTGIFARVYGTTERVLALNCTNNANVKGKGTNTSGISGQSKCTLFYNCVNNGKIIGNERTSGIGCDIQYSVFIGCVNNGDVSQTTLGPATEGMISPSGIASHTADYGVVMYRCKNTGTIGSEDNKMITAGILSTRHIADSIIKECENTGIIISEQAYDISVSADIPVIKTDTSLSSLNEHLLCNKYIIANNIILTDTDKTLVPKEGQEKIELNNLKGDVVLDLKEASSNFTLIIDNCNVSVINGVNKSVKFISSGSTFTIDSDIGNITICSNDLDLESKVIITKDVTAGVIQLDGVGAVSCEINEGAKADRVVFINTGTYTLINYGTISHSTSGEHGNQHTISSIVACDITIYNYGTIEALATESSPTSWAMLFYYGPSVSIYAGDDSLVRCDSVDDHIITANSADHVYIYYKEKAMKEINGVKSQFIVNTEKITSYLWENK